MVAFPFSFLPLLTPPLLSSLSLDGISMDSTVDARGKSSSLQGHCHESAEGTAVTAEGDTSNKGTEETDSGSDVVVVDDGAGVIEESIRSAAEGTAVATEGDNSNNGTEETDSGSDLVVDDGVRVIEESIRLAVDANQQRARDLEEKRRQLKLCLTKSQQLSKEIESLSAKPQHQEQLEEFQIEELENKRRDLAETEQSLEELSRAFRLIPREDIVFLEHVSTFEIEVEESKDEGEDFVASSLRDVNQQIIRLADLGSPFGRLGIDDTAYIQLLDDFELQVAVFDDDAILDLYVTTLLLPLAGFCNRISVQVAGENVDVMWKDGAVNAASQVLESIWHSAAAAAQDKEDRVRVICRTGLLALNGDQLANMQFQGEILFENVCFTNDQQRGLVGTAKECKLKRCKLDGGGEALVGAVLGITVPGKTLLQSLILGGNCPFGDHQLIFLIDNFFDYDQEKKLVLEGGAVVDFLRHKRASEHFRLKFIQELDSGVKSLQSWLVIDLSKGTPTDNHEFQTFVLDAFKLDLKKKRTLGRFEAEKKEFLSFLRCGREPDWPISFAEKEYAQLLGHFVEARLLLVTYTQPLPLVPEQQQQGDPLPHNMRNQGAELQPEQPAAQQPEQVSPLVAAAQQPQQPEQPPSLGDPANAGIEVHQPVGDQAAPVRAPRRAGRLRGEPPSNPNGLQSTPRVRRGRRRGN